MLKISKLSDYGLLATVYLARHRGEVVAAREIASFYHLPVPMVTKVLKTLHSGGLIASHRGSGGGYSFDGDSSRTTLGDLLEVLEGPWDLVECETTNDVGEAVCAIRSACPSRRFMFGINRAIKNAFEQVTLDDVARGVMPVAVFEKSRQHDDNEHDRTDRKPGIQIRLRYRHRSRSGAAGTDRRHHSADF